MRVMYVAAVAKSPEGIRGISMMSSAVSTSLCGPRCYSYICNVESILKETTIVTYTDTRVPWRNMRVPWENMRGAMGDGCKQTLYMILTHVQLKIVSSIRPPPPTLVLSYFSAYLCVLSIFFPFGLMTAERMPWSEGKSRVGNTIFSMYSRFPVLSLATLTTSQSLSPNRM